MRFLFAVMASTSETVPADENEMKAIDEFNDRIESAGQRIMAAGIAGPEHAIVFDNRGGLAAVSQGPVVDSPDFMAGFWVIEAQDESTAHALAADASHACNRRIEVRPFLR